MALHGSSSAAAVSSFPNRVFSNTLVNANTTTVLPADGTIPQSNEGQEFLTVTLTPTSITARVRVEVNFASQCTVASQNHSIALFIGAAAGAVASDTKYMATANGTAGLSIVYEYVPGSISAQVLKVRGGAASSGTFTPNAPTMGGTMLSSISAYEIG